MLLAFLLMVAILLIVGKVSPTTLSIVLKNRLTSKNRDRILFPDNHNRCSDCLNHHSNAIKLSNTGYCGVCGRYNQVWCDELINLYRGMKISEDDICRYLPLINHKQAAIDYSLVGKKISEFNALER
jgi:hypothetical protein